MLSRISGVTKNYDWGSKELVPDFFGIEKSSEPIAEIWFGTHPLGESQTLSGGKLLSESIGKKLSFLVKILSAERALSIQVHPNSQQAKDGFHYEQAKGISLEDPKRNYKDSSHKPEALIALTPFQALCGFRPRADLIQVFMEFGKSEPEFDSLAKQLASGASLAEIFEALIANKGLAKRFLQSVDSSQADLSAKKARDLVEKLLIQFPGDTGALVALMLNEVSLEPGEAIYLPAGNIHAYLSGLGVEVMAASDNVLRSGLTSKHVDVAEVLKLADFSELSEPKVRPKKLAEGLIEYPVDCLEFRVYRAEVSGKNLLADLDLPASAMVVCTAGEVAVSSSLEERELLTKADVVFASAAKKLSLSGSGTAFVILGD
jgi:mannose-6-phosphate isomerase